MLSLWSWGCSDNVEPSTRVLILWIQQAGADWGEWFPVKRNTQTCAKSAKHQMTFSAEPKKQSESRLNRYISSIVTLQDKNSTIPIKCSQTKWFATTYKLAQNRNEFFVFSQKHTLPWNNWKFQEKYSVFHLSVAKKQSHNFCLYCTNLSTYSVLVYIQVGTICGVLSKLKIVTIAVKTYFLNC